VVAPQLARDCVWTARRQCTKVRDWGPGVWARGRGAAWLPPVCFSQACTGPRGDVARTAGNDSSAVVWGLKFRECWWCSHASHTSWFSNLNPAWQKKGARLSVASVQVPTVCGIHSHPLLHSLTTHSPPIPWPCHKSSLPPFARAGPSVPGPASCLTLGRTHKGVIKQTPEACGHHHGPHGPTSTGLNNELPKTSTPQSTESTNGCDFAGVAKATILKWVRTS
jgi:hypothetical protein